MSVIVQSGDLLLEILVGDDLSQDNTGEIVQAIAEKFPGLIRYFRHSENKGPSENLRFIIGEACGEYVAHLDGDDYWLPGKLEAQVKLLDLYSECPAVYTNALVMDGSGIVRGVFNNQLSNRYDINALLRYGNFLNNSSMMYRASVRDSIINIKVPLLDYRIHLRLAQHGEIAYLNQTLIVYRVSSSSSALVHANDRVREMYWEALQDVPRDGVNVNDLGRGMAEFMRSVIFRSIRIGSFSPIRKWWPHVIDKTPLSRGATLYWVVYAVLRTGFVAMISYVCAIVSGTKLKVYYRR